MEQNGEMPPKIPKLTPEFDRDHPGVIDLGGPISTPPGIPEVLHPQGSDSLPPALQRHDTPKEPETDQLKPQEGIDNLQPISVPEADQAAYDVEEQIQSDQKAAAEDQARGFEPDPKDLQG